jgi:hypothetical protein
VATAFLTAKNRKKIFHIRVFHNKSLTTSITTAVTEITEEGGADTKEASG